MGQIKFKDSDITMAKVLGLVEASNTDIIPVFAMIFTGYVLFQVKQMIL